MDGSNSKNIRRSSRRIGKTGLLVLVLVFLAFGATVFGVGLIYTPITESATAIVRLPATMMTQDQAHTEILSQSNMQRAIRESALSDHPADSPTTADVTAISQQLNIWMSGSTDPNTSLAAVHIECPCNGEQSARIALVDRLADQFAELIRHRQQSESDQVYQAAEQATADAQKRLDKARKKLDQFVKQFFEPNKKSNAEGADEANPNVNPNWLALKRQLEHARAYREQLLVDRTPLHPMVQVADQEIVDLEKRLAVIPHELVPEQGNLTGELRQMTDVLPESPGLIGPAAESVDTLEQPIGEFIPPPTGLPVLDTAKSTTPDSQTPHEPPAIVSHEQQAEFLKLQRKVADAEQDYQRAVDRQKEADRARRRMPPIEVVAARVVAVPVPNHWRPDRLALMALMVALAGAAGVGMLGSGVGSHTTFTNVAQARAALPVPVLAVVPAADHSKTMIHRRRVVEGWIQAVCGILLLVASAGVILALAGIVLWW